AVTLEYKYCGYNEVVDNTEGSYDWSGIDSILDDIASRQHQAILRFYYVYPGDPTTVPQYIKDLSGYNETSGTSEGEPTDFPDWAHSALQSFTTNFFTEFANRYNNDPRLAFLQVGFGLWGEHHIYDGPNTIGVHFPGTDYQRDFVNHMDNVCGDLPWSISIDAADGYYGPFDDYPALLNKEFGLFDDSFLHAEHSNYNQDCWNFFDRERYQYSPAGGELSYYTSWDQQHALDPNGPHGISYEEMSADYHISYMIGNDQPDYQNMTRIKEAGMSNGYKFKIISFKASSSASRVQVENIGIAPIYRDAYIAVNGVRSSQSLRLLQPGQSMEYNISSGGASPLLTIESDHLVAGQSIQFEADL
ncbi:MAG TPA: DUF4832 domain-containing protein, partial [Spirochaetota bacterium]|nr:DUF4832 domain-containing protein [Spirochaetota bacterium]